ncbi:MAG: hypothetical protein ACLPM3_10380 [Terracidiphilus sp.]
MGNDCKFEIPKECRDFSETNFVERMRVAKSFIQEITKQVAPQKEIEDSNAAWTTSVRSRFINLCPSDCCPRPDDPRTKRGEFLVDYTWEEKEKGKRVLLAAESEWVIDRWAKSHWYLVEQDFEKLLSVKATFKVLIFSSILKLAKSQATFMGPFTPEFAKERLAASLGNYGHHLPGEVYIFIDFLQTGVPGGDMIYQSFLWLSKKYGKSDVEFEDVGRGLLTRA